MRKILLCCLTLFASTFLFAQGNKSIFLEVGGYGLGFSLNYDARFKKSEKGFGYRFGAGLIPPLEETIINPSTPAIFTLPLGVNHLAGSAPHYLETGLGLTFAFYSGSTSWSFWGLEEEDLSGTSVIFLPSLGYRFAPAGKSFQGRLIISPAISSGGSSFFGGLSFGYKF